MGLDFDSCDICKYTTHPDCFTSVPIPGYGVCKTCQYCLKEYFDEKDATADLEYCKTLLQGSGYTFYCVEEQQDKDEYSVEEICFKTKDPRLVIDKDKRWGFRENSKFNEQSEYFTYDKDELDICLGEAADTYIADNSIVVQAKYHQPNKKWKQRMLEGICKDMEKLETKKRKVDLVK